MSNEEAAKVRRTLHMRFTLPTGDSSQLIAMIKAATPFYQMFGNAQVRLLQNVDDPAKLIQEIEYEAREDWELTGSASPATCGCRRSCRPGARCSPARWRSTFSRKSEDERRRTADRRRRADTLTLHPASVLCRSSSVNHRLTIFPHFVNQSESRRRRRGQRVERRSPAPIAHVPGALLYRLRHHAAAADRGMAGGPRR